MPDVLTQTTERIPLSTDADGTMRIAGTRVTLLTVITAFQEGQTPEQIVQSFGSLRLDDAYAVITYYLRHKAEVDACLALTREKGEKLRQGIEARFPTNGVRERLLARRQDRGSG
ncbi:MAG: DUF433 domain-containing protein [Planctomycetes bacterium]|nr:DUF433 domain-containing protein [Planctomycetota bacterium]